MNSGSASAVSPFASFFETAPELFAERDAYERLMDECTRSFGYPFVPDDHYSPRQQFFDFVQPYGPVDPAVVQRLGYHDPAAFRSDVPASPNWDGSATPGGVLYGTEDGRAVAGQRVPEGGCHRRVEEALGGARPAEAVRIAAEAFESAGEDPRWAGALSAWAACMREQGFDYPSSVAAVDQYQGAAGNPTPEEVRTAVADVKCKMQTRQVDTVMAVRDAFEQGSITAHASEFDTYSRWKKQHLEKVRQVLATAPPPTNRYWLSPSGSRTPTPLSG